MGRPILEGVGKKGRAAENLPGVLFCVQVIVVKVLSHLYPSQSDLFIGELCSTAITRVTLEQ